MSDAFKYLSKYKSMLVIGIISLIICDIFQISIPWFMKDAIDSVKVEGSMRLLTKFSILVVGAALGKIFFSYYLRSTFRKISILVEFDIKNELMKKYLSMPPSFYNDHSIGDLMAHSTNDVKAVRMLCGMAILAFADTVLVLLFALILMIKVNLELTLLGLIPLPFLAGVMVYFAKNIFHKFTMVQENFSKLTEKVEETLSGIKIIKSYVKENEQGNLFKDINKNYMKKNMDLVRIWGVMFPTISFIAGLSLLITLFFGAKFMINGQLTIGEYVAFNQYLLMFIWPMMAIGWVVNLYQRGTASLKRIKAILDIKSEIVESDNAIVEEIGGKIEFRNVSFSYNNNDNILSNLSFIINKGETLGILGLTGSGKSTIADMILRFADAKDGKILIDGINIKDYQLKNLRSQIGYVPQESFLFSYTIEENIGFGKERWSFEEIKRASNIAKIYDNITEFPEKFKTIVGERGVTLSGGQRQRTAISRAIMINPRILILDDAFSSVDTETEAEILSEMKEYMGKRTTILISHRISTLNNADRIIVLDSGKLVEEGNHNDLLNRKGLYYEIFTKQQLTEELEIA
ncbi:ABC transporter ATP-binding protein [candidate division TA06 bacterium]|uniref:ABC transporter ATP-binding protein n=1 Tax=candidate division TA06 bacterium TaxID=2250710 RepID=A0A660SLF7_UNCT6|nr:MAG: ABC transporter ATP-binding protein [candidate division TA06 bacterium]